jgi:hypothetical protein
VFDCLSLPVSIEDMDYQRRACRGREERTARVEVKTTPDHNEKKKKQANEPCLIFMSTMTLQRGRGSRLPHPFLPFLT